MHAGLCCLLQKIVELSSGQIKTYLDPQFDLSNEHYPVILCVNCKILLNKAAKGEKVSFPEMPDYLNIAIAKETRSNPRGVCDCLICIKASQQGRPKKGVAGPVPKKAKRASLTICSTCKQSIGKGITHKCTIASGSSNLVEHAQSLPATQQEQIASFIVSQKAGSVCSSGHQANLELSLAAKGRISTICLNPQIKTPVEFTTENMLQLQKYAGQCNSEMKKISYFIRMYAGRKAFQSVAV